LEVQTPQKPKRKALSKKTRFEVFKRDGFTCQYCGAHPPSVILHVDHITAVAKGGKNDIDNLVTACQPCNSGKSDRPLSEIPASLKDKAAEILEKEEQILGYQRVIESKKLRIYDEAMLVHEVFQDYFPTLSLTDKSMATVRLFVERLGVHEVIDAMHMACSYRKVKSGQEFRYFCGICWKTIKESPNGN